MLKHTDLTKERIKQLINYKFTPAIFGTPSDLEVSFCGEPYSDEKSAKKGPWTKVAEGFEFGPAYRTVWFHIQGKIPASMAGKQVVLTADLGGERTIWKDNSPVWGLDGPHEEFVIFDQAQGGEKVDFYIQCYTGNPQCRVHLTELPREQNVAKLGKVQVKTQDMAIKELCYDADFAFQLLGTLDEKYPSHATLLRALNDVCNQFAAQGFDSVGRCRKLLKDALGSINCELKHTITPVGHAHLDTAWLWPLEITMKKMAHTTANQLALIERYPEYVFCHSQASQYEWLEQQYPILFDRVKNAISGGQWEPVGSMWVEADCNLTGSESLVRQFLYGKRYFREKLGYETEDMWLPDVFGYSAAIPQILSKFSIKYFMTQKISWNQFNKFPHNTFWWQGIDGTRVWSHFPPADTYTGDASPKQIVESVHKHRDKGRSDQSLYVFGWGDGGGGPTERHLEFIRRSRSAPCMPEVDGSKKALQFFREAKARSKDLQTWVGELYFELHRGTYTSQAANKRGNRFSEFLIRDAELLSCFADGYPKSYPATELEAIWKLILLNQFHDIIPGSSVNEVYRDSDRDYAIITASANRIINEKLTSIGSKLDSSGFSRPLALFANSNVSTEASIPWTEESAPSSIRCGDQSLPVQLIEDFDERKLIFASPEGAMGTVAVADFCDEQPLTRTRLKANAAARRIENDELSVRFDQFGNITSIQSLDYGLEFVEQGKLANLFQVFEDRPNFWSAWDVDAFMLETGKDLIKSESFEIVERGPVRVAVEVVKKIGESTIRQRISLGPTPGIRFDTVVDWHEDDTMLKVAFPVTVNAMRATYEIQFGNVERPTHMNTSWDMARFEVCAQKWADLSEGDHGVALINDCKYGYDIQGNTMRLSLLRSPKAPDPMCDMGQHRFTYVLMPHFGPYNYAGVVQAAYAINSPTRHAFLKPTSGEEGTLPVFVECDDRNVIIESVKKAEHGDCYIIRLYECHNSRGRAELTLAVPPQSAHICDMEENEIGELDVVDGMVCFEYKPFEIITLKVRA